MNTVMSGRIETNGNHRRPSVESARGADRYLCGESTRPSCPDDSARRLATVLCRGHEVIIGRDVHADVRIPDPRISRAHLILRFDQGRWLAIDNGSLNGTYVNGYRMPVIDIHDGQSINIGNPQGPRLTFAIGPEHGQTQRPPRMQVDRRLRATHPGLEHRHDRPADEPRTATAAAARAARGADGRPRPQRSHSRAAAPNATPATTTPAATDVGPAARQPLPRRARRRRGCQRPRCPSAAPRPTS